MPTPQTDCFRNWGGDRRDEKCTGPHGARLADADGERRLQAERGQPQDGRSDPCQPHVDDADGTVHAKTGTGNAIQSHRIPDTVFRVMRHKGGLGAAGSHPAVFPVALVEAVLTAFSDPGDLNYEPFCGSGTQLVAAERAGRRCFAMEVDPVYCDVAVRRWGIATGKVAKLTVA